MSEDGQSRGRITSKLVVDVAAGALVGGPLGGLAAAGKVGAGEFLERLFSRPVLQGIAEVREDLLRREVIENLRRLEERLDDLAGQVAAAEQRAVTVEEAAALVVQLHAEGMRAVTEERARMLAAAIAGSFRPDLEAEMKARAARAILQLEPSDVRLLREQQHTDSGPLRAGLDAHPVNRAGLTQSGCVFYASAPGAGGSGYPTLPSGGGRCEVTEIGRAVLRLVESWQAVPPGP